MFFYSFLSSFLYINFLSSCSVTLSNSALLLLLLFIPAATRRFKILFYVQLSEDGDCEIRNTFISFRYLKELFNCTRYISCILEIFLGYSKDLHAKPMTSIEIKTKNLSAIKFFSDIGRLIYFEI